MFEGKAFYIEVVDKNSSEAPAGRPVDESVKELITYTAKAVVGLIVVGGVVHVVSELLIHHLS